MNLDDKLRQSFHELRAADAQGVPLFSRVARPRPRTVTVPWIRLAAGVAGLAALLLVVKLNRPPVTDTQQWATLSNWSATTDELLTGASTPWGSSTLSTPTDSWLKNSNQINQKETL